MEKTLETETINTLKTIIDICIRRAMPTEQEVDAIGKRCIDLVSKLEKDL